MSNFRVGQKVVCVDDTRYRPGLGFEEMPVKGRVYTIRTSVPGEGVRLVEIINPPGEYWDGFVEIAYDPRRFRPVAYPKQSLEQDVALFKRITEMVPA